MPTLKPLVAGQSLTPAFIRWVLAGLVLTGALGPQTGWTQARYEEIPGVRRFTGQMIARPVQPGVWRERGLSAAEVDARMAEARAWIGRFMIKAQVPQTDEYIFKVPEGRTENEVAAQVMSTGLFQYAEPDWLVYPVSCPNDLDLAVQWHHGPDRMRSCDAWDIHTGSSETVVGIVDTGILVTHEDLLLNRRFGYNGITHLWEWQGGDITPINSHGTMTTGAAAANGNNGVGVVGTGWNLGHRMLRPTNAPDGSAYHSDIQACARISIEAGDRVVSCSFGGPDVASNLTTATYIKSIGGLMFWSAGNDRRNLTMNDRDADDLIVVGGTDPDDNAYLDSSYGIFVDLAAPGVNVGTTSAENNSAYVFAGGTSLACPLAAGLAALIWSAYPGLTPDKVEAMLKIGCEDIGLPGVDNQFGYGRINSYSSLRFLPDVYVDFSHSGPEYGTFRYPFNTFAEGYNAAPTGGTVAIHAGTSVETPVISKPMVVFSWGGMVAIGQ